MEQAFEIKLKQILELKGRLKGSTIPVLQAIQEEFGYIPSEIIKEIGDFSEIGSGHISGVSTFYSQFRHKAVGKHIIKVCIGTACHVKGATLVYEAFRRELKLEENEDTDREGTFTLEKVACLGCCTLAPVVQIDGRTFGKVNQQNVKQILKDFLSGKTLFLKQSNGKKEEENKIGEIRLGLGSCCLASGSDDIKDTLEQILNDTGIKANVKQVGCVGMCHQVPLLEFVPLNGNTVLYTKVKPDDVKSIVLKHFTPPSLHKRLSYKLLSSLDKLYFSQDKTEPLSLNYSEKQISDFLDLQKHISTSNKGEINPIDIEEYLREGGFKALAKCLNDYQPKQVVDIILQSGLKGRGGAGFPTGKKWEAVHVEKSATKFVICNGDEGDPGAFMDRMLLESFPYRILEGMAIAAFATGAAKGFLYIRAEYPVAVRRIRFAIQECYKKSLLGQNILKSGFSFDLEIFEGAGAFVCGEETALIASMEGFRGIPRPRPPFPSSRGLYGFPTLINNVETMASVSWIIRNGSEAFSKIGTQGGMGTKVFALAGKIKRGGLIEVPMGITLAEIVEKIGGGIQGDNQFKAVQIGGPSGGCIPASLASTPVDFTHLNQIGAMMGSGGLVVLDHTDCMVDIARYFLSFTQEQSCGRCTYCRIGTRQMLVLLDKFCQGEAQPGDLEKLENLAHLIKKGSLCGLGKTAPNPVLTSLKYFRSEYEAHLQGICPAKKCKALIKYTIHDDCIGCTKCAQDCPTGAILFKPYEVHSIDQEKCIKCNICLQVCPTGSVVIINANETNRTSHARYQD